MGVVSGPAPELSVVLQVGPQRERGSRALRSLIAQSAVGRMEILLFDYAAQDFPPLPGSDHPSVRIHKRDAVEPFGQSRSVAAGLARGRIVAFIEDHCLAHPGWAEAVLAAHDQGYAGVGPEVHNGNPGVGISDAIHLFNYARWLPPAASGETDLIVGHNSSYLLKAILAYGEQLPTLLRCDTILQWRMVQDGARLAVSAEARISHQNETDLPSLARGAYLWNRMFAPTRAEVFEWSILRRSAWLVLAPLIPLVRTARLLCWFLRNRQDLLVRCIRALPIVLVGHSAAAVGQMVGLAAGLGATEVAFLRFEITRRRLVASASESGAAA